jgi:hypothetical protein
VEGIIGNEDQIAEDVDSVEYNFELTWSYGKFDFNLSYAYVDLDKDVTGDETHEDFFLLVRRYFGR